MDEQSGLENLCKDGASELVGGGDKHELDILEEGVILVFKNLQSSRLAIWYPALVRLRSNFGGI